MTILSRKAWLLSEFNWGILRNALLFLTGASFLAFIAQTVILIASYFMPASVPPANVKIPQISAGALEPIESFQQKVQKRNVFTGPAQPVEAPKPVGIMEKVKDLSLIGIVATGTPEAIVKDAKSAQTYFLKKGQKLRDLELVEIKRSSVILKSGNEQKEIFLA